MLGQGLPKGFGEAIAPVWYGLSQNAYDVLRTGSLLGRQFSLRHVAELLGHSTVGLGTAGDGVGQQGGARIGVLPELSRETDVGGADNEFEAGAAELPHPSTAFPRHAALPQNRDTPHDR